MNSLFYSLYIPIWSESQDLHELSLDISPKLEQYLAHNF